MRGQSFVAVLAVLSTAIAAPVDRRAEDALRAIDQLMPRAVNVGSQFDESRAHSKKRQDTGKYS